MPGVEEGVVELAVVGDRPHDLLAVGLDVIDDADVLGVGVDDPDVAVELVRAAVAAAQAVLVLGDEDAVVGGEGVVADPLDDLERIEVVVRRPRGEGIHGRVVGRREVAGLVAVEPDDDAGVGAGAGRDGPGRDLGDGEAGLGQAGPGPG